MKKWFDYQMENQVQNHDWDPYATPVANIKDSFEPTLASIKESYYNGTCKIYFSKFFTEAYYQKEATNGSSITAAQLKEYIDDPAYAGLTKNIGCDYYNLTKQDEESVILMFSTKFNLNPSGMLINVHLQQPGQMFPMHVDRVQRADNGLFEPSKYNRYIVFLDDWKYGQMYQFGETFIKWKAGDVYTWPLRDMPHGTANVGYDPRFLLIITAMRLNSTL
jgi:hypothetical protein